MPLFENSLGFTWEIANYRQVQSGGKRLTSEPHILIRHKITHVLHLLEFLLSHVGWVSARMSHTAKPDSQECQAWTLARLSKAIRGARSSVLSKKKKVSHTSTAGCMLIFPLSVMQFISSGFTRNNSLTFWMTEALSQLTSPCSYWLTHHSGWLL